MNCPYHSKLTIGADQGEITAVFDGDLTITGTALSLLASFARYVADLPSTVRSVNLDLTSAKADEIDSYILPGFVALNEAAAKIGINVNVSATPQISASLRASGLSQLLLHS